MKPRKFLCVTSVTFSTYSIKAGLCEA